jgi:hypothetical protein
VEVVNYPDGRLNKDHARLLKLVEQPAKLR